jgi:hypothetical protein
MKFIFNFVYIISMVYQIDEKSLLYFEWLPVQIILHKYSIIYHVNLCILIIIPI